MIKLKTKFQDEHFSLGEVVDVYIVTMPAGRIKAQAIAKDDGIHTFYYEKLETFWNNWEDAPEDKPEKAVEKLKEFKSLKDKGLKFEGWDNIIKDLNLLFGCEE